jgi:plasmid segregation protein ParM
LDESDIDAILSGDASYDETVIATMDRETHAFVGDLLSALRERMLDLHSSKTVFVGGGSMLLKRYIESSRKVGDMLVVDDLAANARGYEFLYRLESESR